METFPYPGRLLFHRSPRTLNGDQGCPQGKNSTMASFPPDRAGHRGVERKTPLAGSDLISRYVEIPESPLCRPKGSLMQNIKRVSILGCPFDAITFRDTVECIEQALIKDTCLQIVPGSIDFVIKANKNPDFASLLSKADLVVADGVPIIWAANILGDPLKGRVSGTDLVWECARISSELQFQVALVGGKYELTSRASQLMKDMFPRALLTPIETPFPMDPNANRDIVKGIRAIGAKIVLAAFGAPEQERWVQDLKPRVRTSA